ncbi:MAG: glycosyltransferase family 4 protein [Acidimicrobiales bacterium]
MARRGIRQRIAAERRHGWARRPQAGARPRGAGNREGVEAPRRVLIVSAFVLPHVGGVEVIVQQQAEHLAGEGFDVTVVSSDPSGSMPSSPGRGYHIVRNRAWNGLERRWGIPFPVWRIGGYVRLFRLVRKSDVIHVHDVTYLSSLCAAVFARLNRRTLLVTQHVAVVAHDNKMVEFVQRTVYGTWGRLVWRWADEIILYNPIVKTFLVDSGVDAEKIRLVYNGIDTEFFSPGDRADRQRTRVRYSLPLDKPIVLFVGRLVPKKGVDRLIAARDSAYHIVLVGSGMVPRIPEDVTCLGPLGRHELRDVYRAVDLFAFPAVGEMLTLVMQEAMSCGLPVVATDEPGYATYLFGPDDIALVPSEAPDLKRAIQSLLGDEDRLARMRAASRRVAIDRFNWRMNAAKLMSLYEPLSTSRISGDGSTPDDMSTAGASARAATTHRFDHDPDRVDGRSH